MLIKSVFARKVAGTYSTLQSVDPRCLPTLMLVTIKFMLVASLLTTQVLLLTVLSHRKRKRLNYAKLQLL